MLRSITRLHQVASCVCKTQNVAATLQKLCLYSTEPTDYPTTCPGANYLKGSEEVLLKPDAEYPDWLWTLGGPKRELTDMSPEIDGKAYYKRMRKAKIREQNMIRKQRRF